MSIEQPTTDSGAITPVSSDTALVETKTTTPGNDVKDETAALIEAIKKRAQAEIQAAGDLTRETYLNAVRQTREAIENDQLIDRDRIEESFQYVQKEAEKNWNVVLAEIESLGVRLADAAQTAWDKLMQPKDSNKSE